MSLHYLIRSGGESELLVGNSVVALFKESEQLWSHVRTTKLLSKPVSPIVGWCCRSVYALGASLIFRPGPAGIWWP